MLETVDSYFYLGGKKAYVIPGHIETGVEGAVVTTDSKDSPALLITVLKVVSYLTIAIPVLVLIVKAVLRSIYAFHIINAQQKLEEGINISQDTITKIQELMPKILRGEQDDAQITWHGRANNRVFSLTAVPGLVFKMVCPGVGVLQAGRL